MSLSVEILIYCQNIPLHCHDKIKAKPYEKFQVYKENVEHITTKKTQRST